ncbi:MULTISPECIES: tetratricopeptide repeat protein [unclassified Bacillus (in: firmicutes)]|uniref:tetratricopeptide repeat protein n=1 Tax=unclassified Bacillus (in: firmicutes) TaxID=185979 RepID=UPI000B892187|nr:MULTISPECIES: tetratricopeptide repeat protein [unclassified Bacillus (in: firmicutes)]
MRFEDKSIEELLDMEDDFRQAISENEGQGYHRLVNIYEALYRKIESDPDSEYTPSLDKIKKDLILYLVKYGTYLKTEYQKDDRLAEHTLRQALRYDRDNPAAHYRLGFLAYKARNYTGALDHFQKAISKQKKTQSEVFKLSNQQLYNSHLYLTNSALHFAQQTQAEIEKLSSLADLGKVPNLEKSPLYHLINQNEQYLSSNAFKIITKDSARPASKEECDLLVDSQTYHHIVLYFGDRETTACFNGKEVSLTPNQAEFLYQFFLKSDSENPLNKEHFRDILTNRLTNGEIEDNTYIQNMRRLRQKLNCIELPLQVIESKRKNNQTGYYYNGTLPYTIIHRSDDPFFQE